MTCANITLFSQHCMIYVQAWARVEGGCKDISYQMIMSEQINLCWEPFSKHCVELHGTDKSSLY